MSDNRSLEDLSWNELEQAIENFIASDGPNADDLSAVDFFALWAQFDAERKQRTDITQTPGKFSL